MNRLYYAPEAINDLNEIWAYVSEELKSPSLARSMTEEILDTIEKLQDFSEMGASLNVITAFESDYRFLVCGRYIAFYRVVKSEVYIDRVLHSSRDYLRILFGR